MSPNLGKLMTKIAKSHKGLFQGISAFVIGLLLILGSALLYFHFKQTSTTAIINLQRQKPVSQTLTIPAIKLKVPIKTQLTPQNMKTAVCQEHATDYPGMPGNLVLAGHNYNNQHLFSNLDQVKTGQKIIINDYYVYQIDTIKAIYAKHEFKRGQQARITLYTCLKENNPDYRLVIQGHLLTK